MKRIATLGGAVGIALAAVLAACGGQQTEPQSPADEAAADVAEESADSASADKPCQATNFEFEEVKAACDEGGVKAAKSLMKDYVKRAKEAGNRVKCSSCHDNTKTYTLADNAVEDLRAILGGN